jgi:hypothetical protein
MKRNSSLLVINNAVTNKMKKLALIWLILIIFPQSGFAAFVDVTASHQNYIAVNYLEQNKIISGYGNGTYMPDQLINRVEALKIILEGKKIIIPDTPVSLKFSDTDNNAWYAKYIAVANEMNIANGNPDGTFSPEKTITRAEFIKMLLMANNFAKEKWENLQLYDDVIKGAWYAPYMNYAGQAGLIIKDSTNSLYPGKEFSRGEVAETLYIMEIILNGKNTKFLLEQAQSQMSQIDFYIRINNTAAAKRASELAVDMTQQAYKNAPDDISVLGSAKLARAYDFVVNSYIAAIEQRHKDAADWANQAIAKSTEAMTISIEAQPIALHITQRANEILEQITPSF